MWSPGHHHQHTFLIRFATLVALLRVVCAHPPNDLGNLVRMDASELDEFIRYLRVAGENPSDRDQKNANTVSTSQPKTESMPREAEDWTGIGIDLTSPMYLPEKNGRKRAQHELERNTHQQRAKEDKLKLCEEAGRRRHLATKVRHFLHSQFQHIWSDHFGIEVLGMNVAVNSIRIRHIRMPKIHVEPSCPPTDSQSAAPLSITVSGGSLSLLAEYRSTYRTVRTGQLRVRLRDFQMLWTDGQTDQRECAERQRIDQVLIRFEPRLLDEVEEAVRTHLNVRVAHLMCARLEHFLRAELRPEW